MARALLPLCAIAALIWGMAAHAERKVMGEGTAQEGGIDVRWTMTAGGSASEAGFGQLDVFVTDSRAGAPISYENGALLGWLQRRQAALIEPDQSCPDRVMALATQGIGQRGDIDLNGYRIVTLNSDGSMAFINPFVGFNNAKLESIIDLHARPMDWVQLHDRMEYWVLLADPVQLVSVDLQTRRVTKTIDLPKNSGASRLMAASDGQSLWIALPMLGQIATVDLRSEAHTLALQEAPGIERLFAGNVLGWSDAAGTVTLLEGARQVRLTAPPVAIMHSANAAGVVLASADGRITVIPDHGGPSAEITLDHPIADMRLFDTDRRALVIGGAKASVIDLATQKRTMGFSIEPGAGQIAMTEKFAYALGAPSGRASMIALEDLIRARPQVLDIIVSASVPQDQAEAGRLAVVASPEGDGLLVTSPTEGMIYQYSEGMMAPSGSYSNYRRLPVGIGIVDYSLREIEKGHYRAAMRVGAGGNYELILGGIGPRFSSCAQVTLAGDPNVLTEETARLHAALIAVTAAPASAKSLRISVQIIETLPAQGGSKRIAGLSDLKLLVFDKRSGWQRRIALVDAGDGRYEGALRIPAKSRYEFLVSSAAANLSFVEGQMGEKLLGAGP